MYGFLAALAVGFLYRVPRPEGTAFSAGSLKWALPALIGFFLLEIAIPAGL